MMPCILVFGMPRSGTTWVGKLFDSHPDTLYRHEPDSARQLDMPMFAGMEDGAGCHRRQLEKFVASMPRLRTPRVVGKRPLFPKHYQSAAGLLAYRASVAAAKVAGRVRRDFPCPYRPAATHHGRARLVWKSIESPGRLGACMTALPQARAVYLMRHPCGYVASVLRGRRGHHLGAAAASDPFWHMKLLLATPAGRAHGLELDDIRRLAPEEQLAWRWVLTQETVLSDVAGSDRVLVMRYEDICAEPVAATRRMFAFTGLEWAASTEAFIHACTRHAESDYYSVFKNPRVSARRWREELPASAVDRVRAILERSYLQGFYNEAPDVEVLNVRAAGAAS